MLAAHDDETPGLCRITGKQLTKPNSDRPWEQVKAEILQRMPAGPRWYIVHAIGRPDSQVLEWLQKLKVDFYYPKVLEMRRVPRRQMSGAQRRSGVEVKKPQEAPLFPRYIFTNFDMGRSGWREVFKFAGCGGMVCEGDLPVWIPDGLIVSIKSREHNGMVPGATSVRVLFNLGDEVMVTSGPFASFPGIVERGVDIPIEELDPSTRIKVAVNVFGRATPLDLELWQVDKR
jgi:transcriptional antiterminator NusG